MPLTAYPWHQTQWRDILERRHALPHALLIRGGEGIGKLDFARKLAQSVACDSPAGDGAACGECQSCRWFAIGTHPDYREVLPEVLRPRREDDAPPSERKPSQFISIDDVRNLHDFINLTARGRRRQDHRVLSCRNAQCQRSKCAAEKSRRAAAGHAFHIS